MIFDFGFGFKAQKPGFGFLLSGMTNITTMHK